MSATKVRSRRRLSQMQDWLDGQGLDLLVCNAGIADPVGGPIEELSLE